MSLELRRSEHVGDLIGDSQQVWRERDGWEWID